MKKLWFFVVTLLICCCTENLKAQEMNAFGVSFEQSKDEFERKIVGTFLESSFAFEVEERDGKVSSVTGVKEMCSKRDANIIFWDMVYNLWKTEKYVTKEIDLDKTYRVYKIGDGEGYVELFVERKLVHIRFNR